MTREEIKERAKLKKELNLLLKVYKIIDKKLSQKDLEYFYKLIEMYIGGTNGFLNKREAIFNILIQLSDGSISDECYKIFDIEDDFKFQLRLANTK